MDLQLKDKLFIISGSSRGIGKGIAEVFLKEGAKVLLCGRDEKSLNATFDCLDAQFVGQVYQVDGDISKLGTLQEIDTLLEKETLSVYGLVANAGAVKPVPDINITKQDWLWYFEANLFVAETFVNHFSEKLKQTRGCITFINSIAGLEEIGAPMPYSASKAALNSYAKGLSKRMAQFKIRVNTVSPGNILFKGGNWDNKLNQNKEGVLDMIERNVPLNCFGSPEDIGNAVAFLSSSNANFVTGSNLVVDGGQTNLV
jgi:3-oxoacyl-[acyl-carrier protein] reductase